jgi:plastocyanin
MTRKLLPAVLLLVALGLAACGDDDGGNGGGEASTELDVAGTDSLDFEPDAFTVPAGEEITVSLSADGVEHDFVVEDLGGEDVDVVHADAGETATGTFTADEAGTYTVFCSVPGHREAGMEATLEVVDEG